MHPAARLFAKALRPRDGAVACAGLFCCVKSRPYLSCDGADAAQWPLAGYSSAQHVTGLAKIHEAEQKLLSMMLGTPFTARDVPIQLDVPSRCFLRGHPETKFAIRTVIVGEQHAASGRPPIVLVHGFMMGAAAFFKWLPLLARERTVYAIDVIGMGGSGRPPFEADKLSAEEAENLLVEPFEQWAEAMGLTEFDLLGHSFGGFVCSAWAAKHPSRIRCLGLLSPLLGFSDARIERIMPKNEDSWQRKALKCVIETAWARHITPQSLVRWVPGAKGWMERASSRRFQSMAAGVTEEEGRLLSEYVIATMDMPASTEASATVCFEPFLRPTEVAGGTIKRRVAGLPMPVFAVYGDRDWMDRAAPEEVPNCQIFTLQDSGHHLYLDNPEGLSAIVQAQLQRAA